MNKVIIITTGGTIDKTYDEQLGRLTNATSVVGDLIEHRLRLPSCEVQVVPLMNKDSLKMTDEDRSTIIAKVEELSSEGVPIILVHGTDTLEQTARKVWEVLNPSVPIILTGAMRPLGFVDSDAMQNLTESLIAARLLSPGVYAVFHNQIFLAPEFHKDRKRGTFLPGASQETKV